MEKVESSDEEETDCEESLVAKSPKEQAESGISCQFLPDVGEKYMINHTGPFSTFSPAFRSPIFMGDTDTRKGWKNDESYFLACHLVKRRCNTPVDFSQAVESLSKLNASKARNEQASSFVGGFADAIAAIRALKKIL